MGSRNVQRERETKCVIYRCPLLFAPQEACGRRSAEIQTDLFHSVSSSPAGYFLRHTTVANPPGNGDRTGLNEIKRGCTGVKMPDDTVTQAISANGTAEPRPELEIDRNKERD